MQKIKKLLIYNSKMEENNKVYLKLSLLVIEKAVCNFKKKYQVLIRLIKSF